MAADVLEEPQPAISQESAARILRERFGIDGELSDLPSERDRNFLVRLAGRQGGGDHAVLKISNTAEDHAVVAMENAAMAHVARTAPTLPIPRILRTVDDETIVAVRGAGLIAGVELAPPPGEAETDERAYARQKVEALRDAGVLVGTTSRRGNVLKVRPPLVWTESPVDFFVEKLESVL